jgi:hypothetical protein
LQYHDVVNGPEQFVAPASAAVRTLRLLLQLCLSFALAVGLALPVFAQHGRASASHAVSLVHGGVPRFAGGGRFGFSRGARGFDSHDRYSTPYLSLPFPFFDDALDSGDIYSTGYPVAASLPPFLPVGASGRYDGGSVDAARSSSSQPLMIELQNGRYVRVNNPAIDGEALPFDSRANTAGAADSANRSQGPMVAAPAANDLAPVVLIFRDGHSEQVRDYTIANGTLYARGDFYTDGYWNKNIDLSGLNVVETVHANAERSVKFLLPSSPNEVITRP